MQTDLADYAIEYAQKRGASYAEARLEKTSTNSFMLKNGIPEISGFDNIYGLGIRMIVNKGLCFASTNKLDKQKIKSLIDRAMSSATSSPKLREQIHLAEDDINKTQYEVKQKIKLEDVDPAEKVGQLIAAEKAIVDTGIKVPGRYLTLSDSTTTEYLVNSEGTQLLATVPKVAFMYFLTVAEGNKSMQRYWQYGNSGGFEFVKDWNIPEIVRHDVEACSVNLKTAVKTPNKVQDLVVAPQVVGIMVHESVGHPYEADRILGREGAQAGESFVTQEMVGYQIGSEVATVVDDPTIPNSYGFPITINHWTSIAIKNRIIFCYSKNIIIKLTFCSIINTC